MPGPLRFRRLSPMLLLLLLTIAVPGHSRCVEPQAPRFPSPGDITLKSMELAHRAMQRYINGTETYLECLSPEDRKQKMDEVLATIKQVTTEFNALSVAYRKHRDEVLFSDSVD